MRLTEALGKGTGLLGFGGIEGAGRDARALLAEAVGIAPDRLVLEAQRDLTEAEWAAFQTLLSRRLEHEPVARILGRRTFWGRDFKITPQVLDPRPETETLIAEALAGPAPGRLLDLGTGSGIIAVTLLAEWPGATAVATDLCAGALAVARENAQVHQVGDRLTFVESDWFLGVEGAFDLIASNPPYIAADEMPGLARDVRGHDPDMALTPGGDGLDAYRAIAAEAAAHLAPGGRLIVEIGPTQGAAVAGMFRSAGLTGIAVRRDLDGRDRVVRAERG